MKIHQVEELVGVTKKNIRFYEEQGLLRPERNPENGYREYTLRDVEQLRRVKLLRKLDVPCEQIRRVTAGELSLAACLRAQRQTLEKRGSDLVRMEELCTELADSDMTLDALKAEDWLDRMRELEKGGVEFVDANKSDVKKRRWGAVVSAAVFILLMIGLIGLILWGNHAEPLPTPVLVFLLLIPLVIIAGVGLALIQRMKELKGGELDEAGHY
ncbi:MAG: MerR family transcriptional regulator [Oscillospiraceae bacterium]|nr:MerR family transcriptional regulator [Oscillospiraceae bacterium]